MRISETNSILSLSHKEIILEVYCLIVNSLRLETRLIHIYLYLYILFLIYF